MSMHDRARNSVWLPGLVLICGFVILCAGKPAPQYAKWEYAVYQAQTEYDRDGNVAWRRFEWYSKGKTVPVWAEGEKFRLFCKLGAQETLTDYHDVVLWNHLGDQGWEYVEQFASSIGNHTIVQTVFRRPVDG